MGIPFRHELAHALNTAKHRVLTFGKLRNHCVEEYLSKYVSELWDMATCHSCLVFSANNTGFRVG
jgi:hypothetical protein